MNSLNKQPSEQSKIVLKALKQASSNELEKKASLRSVCSALEKWTASIYKVKMHLKDKAGLSMDNQGYVCVRC